jgi:hypothetical protein
VPIGLGFQIRARAELGQIGFDAFLDAVVTTSFGVECTNECTVGGTIEVPSHDGYFKPRLPNLDAAPQFELSASAFVYGELKLGSPLSEDWRFKAAEVRGGIEQRFDLASREVQAADPLYASSYTLKPLLEAKAESTLTSLGNLLSVNLSELNFTPDLPELARSPRGTLTISPGSVAPGDETALGERATFSVALAEMNYLGAYAVEGVEIRWRKPNGASISLEPGRPGCTDIEAAQDQVTFTCETDFLEEHAGDQTFYAFLKTRIWGVPVPVPLEVAPNGSATVTVSSAAGGRVILVEPEGGLDVETEAADGNSCSRDFDPDTPQFVANPLVCTSDGARAEARYTGSWSSPEPGVTVLTADVPVSLNAASETYAFADARFGVDFLVSDGDVTYEATGQVQVVAPGGSVWEASALIKLDGNGGFTDATGNGTVPVSRPGRLSPGAYQLDLSARIEAFKSGTTTRQGSARALLTITFRSAEP